MLGEYGNSEAKDRYRWLFLPIRAERPSCQEANLHVTLVIIVELCWECLRSEKYLLLDFREVPFAS